MRLLLLFAILAHVAFSQYTENCSYNSTSLDNYNLSNISSFSVMDSNGSNWRVRVCNTSYDESFSPFPYASVVMTNSNGTVLLRANNNGLWADSPLGSKLGVEVVYGSDVECTPGVQYKTVVEFLCSHDGYSAEVVTTGCDTTIYVTSLSACPNPAASHMSRCFARIRSMRFFIFCAFIMIILSLSVVACVSLIRRRRIQKQLNRSFSNIAFQPVPNRMEPSVEMDHQQFFSPFIGQPDYFYYPQQQVQLDQNEMDERMAVELQAKFDRETA